MTGTLGLSRIISLLKTNDSNHAHDKSVRFRVHQRSRGTLVLVLILIGLMVFSLMTATLTVKSVAEHQLVWKVRSAGMMVWNRYHEMFNPAVDIHDLREEEKIILFWTPFFGHLKYNIGYGRDPFKNCPVSNCATTNQRSFLNRSSAVIFHPVEFSDLDLPQARSPQQLWVFFMLESPPHTGGVFTESTRGLFNITMTYRRDSDIFQPYYVVEPREVSRTSGGVHMKETNNREGSASGEIGNTTASPRLAWIVSNCKTIGKREEFVQELRKHIPVDIFGRCGPNTCSELGGLLTPPEPDICYRFIRERYRFYLSLENSKCHDYITEKFFLALNHNLIPIVYGAAKSDYETVAPNNSFIFAEDFATPSHLAEYIRQISASQERLASYTKWRPLYRVRRVSTDGFCELCKRLNQKPAWQHRYTDINSWWHRDGICQ